jgi:hypothetical protein
MKQRDGDIVINAPHIPCGSCGCARRIIRVRGRVAGVECLSCRCSFIVRVGHVIDQLMGAG